VNGSTFKRKLKSGATVWCFSFYAGRDENGKPINLMKGGFETKGAASTAKRDAIAEYEKTHGKLSRHRGAPGTMTWGYSIGDETKNGFADQGAARAALVVEMQRRAAAERVPAEVDPTYAEYVKYWLNEHASRRMLAIIRKRRILDFGRPVGVNEVAELEAQVLEISTGSRMLPEFLNDGLEVGQRTNAWQRRRVGRPRLTTEAGEQESGLNHFQGDTAVKPGAGLALV
jgi:hypothetical protein